MEKAVKRKTKHGHNHMEAFALMRYTCRDCQFSEVYWNSRDGVTPFGHCCPLCRSREMRHVSWQSDVYAPDHIPTSGQGVWIDMPDCLRRPCAASQVKSADGTHFEVQGERHKEMIERIASNYREGEPWLIRWPGARLPSQEKK